MAKSADAFRTISEVADWLGVQTHVLRFWESKFTQVKPVKRAGGRRYYRPADMFLLGGIQKLLHEDGLTIKGVQKILREKGMAHVSALSPVIDGVGLAPTAPISKPAPFVSAPEEEVEPVSADVVPFVQEPKTGEDVKPIERPSFTQDAVVLPTDDDHESKSEAVPEETESTISEDEAVEAAEAEPSEPEIQIPEVVDEDTVETSVSTDTPEATAEAAATIEVEVPFQGDHEPETEAPESAAEKVPVQDQEPIIAQETDKTSETEDIAEPAVDETPEDEEEPIAVLPSFLSRSPRVEPVTDTPPAEEVTQSVTMSTQAPAEPIAEAPKPKPDNIDVPDTPSEAEMATTPRALTALSKVRSLTPDQAASIAPLIAQLRDVRDRMTQARKE